MLRSTFQLGTGVGARRERALWDAGIFDWAQLPGAPAGLLSARRAGPLVAAAAALEAALAGPPSLRLEAVASGLPAREHWRLYGTFADDAVYLDIEAGSSVEGITAIGLCDDRGPRILLPGRGLEEFPAQLSPQALLVTFNGASFDVPVLRRRFPDWRPPAAHVDLLPVLGRLGQRGGLKAIEDRMGLGRPDHLRGLDGHQAAMLYRHGARGDRTALRLFAEYNLYDVINLRTLMGLAYNRTIEALGLPAAPVPVSWRGDVLYDVSKTLLAL